MEAITYYVVELVAGARVMSGKGQREARSGECADVRSAVRRHGRKLLDLPGVVGVGLGKRREGECLTVLTDGREGVAVREVVADRVPGVPAVVMEVGILKPLTLPGEPRKRNLTPRRRI